jgi:hypothetical protein
MAAQQSMNAVLDLGRVLAHPLAVGNQRTLLAHFAHRYPDVADETGGQQPCQGQRIELVSLNTSLSD